VPNSKITDFRIIEAIRLIDLNLDQDFDFNDLAETLNLSVTRLRHLFKEQTGVSFRKYLRQTRMQWARQLLETSFISVKETAKRSGIKDTSHFVRDFEKEFGLSPARYRKRYHSAEKTQLPGHESEQKTEIAGMTNR